MRGFCVHACMASTYYYSILDINTQPHSVHRSHRLIGAHGHAHGLDCTQSASSQGRFHIFNVTTLNMTSSIIRILVYMVH